MVRNNLLTSLKVTKNHPSHPSLKQMEITKIRVLDQQTSKTRFYKLPAARFRQKNLKFYKNSEKYRKTLKDIQQHVTKYQTCLKIKMYIYLKFQNLMEIMEN